MKAMTQTARGLDSLPSTIRKADLMPSQMRDVNRNWGATVLASSALLRETVLNPAFHKQQFIPLGLETAIKVALKVMDKYIPDAPREVMMDVHGEVTGLPPQMLMILAQPAPRRTLPSTSRSDSCEIPSDSSAPSASLGSTHGRSTTFPRSDIPVPSASLPQTVLESLS